MYSNNTQDDDLGRDLLAPDNYPKQGDARWKLQWD